LKYIQLYFVDTATINDHLFLPANLWKKNYKRWPIQGDIKLQYFEGIITKREWHNSKEYFTIQWLTDGKFNEMECQTVRRHALWVRPIPPCLVITTEAWTKSTSTTANDSSQLKRTFHVHGKTTLNL